MELAKEGVKVEVMVAVRGGLARVVRGEGGANAEWEGQAVEAKAVAKEWGYEGSEVFCTAYIHALHGLLVCARRSLWMLKM